MVGCPSTLRARAWAWSSQGKSLTIIFINISPYFSTYYDKTVTNALQGLRTGVVPPLPGLGWREAAEPGPDSGQTGGQGRGHFLRPNSNWSGVRQPQQGEHPPPDDSEDEKDDTWSITLTLQVQNIILMQPPVELCDDWRERERDGTMWSSDNLIQSDKYTVVLIIRLGQRSQSDILTFLSCLESRSPRRWNFSKIWNFSGTAGINPASSSAQGKSFSWFTWIKSRIIKSWMKSEMKSIRRSA